METQAPDGKPTTRDVWMRGLFMFLFIIAFTAGQWLLNLLTIVQFLWLLFAREPNQFIVSFGGSLAVWLAEVGRFLTCATEEKPFPWKPWPPKASTPAASA
jgi:hypothetical protein